MTQMVFVKKKKKGDLDLAIGNVVMKKLVEEQAFDGPSVTVNDQLSVGGPH